MRPRLFLLLLLTAGLSAAGYATPLTALETRNLAALTRAVGIVKYFYPNRHTAKVSWEAVLVNGIPPVRRARTPVALAGTLDSLLRPWAPLISFVADSSTAGTAQAGAPAPAAARYYYWEHRGLGRDKAGLPLVRLMLKLAGVPYASAIRASNGPAVRQLFGIEAPRHTVRLTDSVWLSVPVVLAEAGYQQRLLRPATQPARRLTATSQEGRLASVMLVWNIIQHFYPYRQLLTEARWEAALPAALQQAATATTEAAQLAVLRRLLARIPDRHLGISPQTLTGLRILPPPMALQLRWVEYAAVIAAVPAALRPQLMPGAILTHLNGRPVGYYLDSLQQQLPAPAGVVARQLATEQLLTRLAATQPSVTFTVQDTSGREVRGRWALRQLRGRTGPLVAVQELQPGIFYLQAAHLRYIDFQRMLPQLQAARGLIVDLRQRPHYDLLRILPHFTRQALAVDSVVMPVLRQPDFRAAAFQGVAPDVTVPRLPLVASANVFLVGPDTYSFGETVAELVRHFRLGVLMGEPTGGTNGEMNFATIGRTYLLSWTGRRVVPRGVSYQGQGLMPELLVPPTRRALALGQDAAVVRALEWLLASPPPQSDGQQR